MLLPLCLAVPVARLTDQFPAERYPFSLVQRDGHDAAVQVLHHFIGHQLVGARQADGLAVPHHCDGLDVQRHN